MAQIYWLHALVFCAVINRITFLRSHTARTYSAHCCNSPNTSDEVWCAHDNQTMVSSCSVFFFQAEQEKIFFDLLLAEQLTFLANVTK